MPKFEVLLNRTVTQRYRLEVQAANKQEATEKAQAQQGDLDFNEGSNSDPDYGVEEVNEVQEPPGAKDLNPRHGVPIDEGPRDPVPLSAAVPTINESSTPPFVMADQLTAHQKKAYLRHKGSRCPHCHSSHLEAPGRRNDGADWCTNEIKCLDCHAKWNEVFTLTDVESTG